MTAAQELVLIDAALTRIYGIAAQSITAKERSLQMLAINDLIKRKKELEEVIATTTDESAGGIALVQFGDAV